MVAYRVYFNGVLKQTFNGDVAIGTITGLTANTTYSNITVRAWDGVTESGDSNPISTKTIATTTLIQISSVSGGDSISGCAQSLAGFVYATNPGAPIANTTICYTGETNGIGFDGQYRWWKYGTSYSVLMNNVGLVLAIKLC
jgi:hypothetical protein